MIKIKNLNKTFLESNSEVEIFRDVNIEINNGDFVSIIGPSGSGKSTFINILGGIDREYSGDIDIFGNDISKFSESEMTNFRGKNISYIFQNFKLIENLTLRENIDLVVEMNNLERNFSTLEILKIVGLEKYADKYVFNLSGGERQRVAIARAFVGKTKLLLADEPTGALDPKNKSIITDLIIDLHKKTKNTIIMITHDDDVAKISDYSYKTSNLSLIKN